MDETTLNSQVRDFAAGTKRRGGAGRGGATTGRMLTSVPPPAGGDRRSRAGPPPCDAHTERISPVAPTDSRTASSSATQALAGGRPPGSAMLRPREHRSHSGAAARQSGAA